MHCYCIAIALLLHCYCIAIALLLHCYCIASPFECHNRSSFSTAPVSYTVFMAACKPLMLC